MKDLVKYVYALLYDVSVVMCLDFYGLILSPDVFFTLQPLVRPSLRRTLSSVKISDQSGGWQDKKC